MALNYPNFVPYTAINAYYYQPYIEYNDIHNNVGPNLPSSYNNRPSIPKTNFVEKIFSKQQVNNNNMNNPHNFYLEGNPYSSYDPYPINYTAAPHPSEKHFRLIKDSRLNCSYEEMPPSSQRSSTSYSKIIEDFKNSFDSLDQDYLYEYDSQQQQLQHQECPDEQYKSYRRSSSKHNILFLNKQRTSSKSKY